MKKALVICLIVTSLLLTAVGCAENANQPESSAPSSTGAVAESSASPTPSLDNNARWETFVTDMKQQGVSHSHLETLEATGIT